MILRGPLLALAATIMVLVAWALDSTTLGVIGACLALFSASMSIGDILGDADDDHEAVARIIARQHEHPER